MDDTYVRFANEMIDKAPMPNEWIDNTNRQLIEAALKTVQNPSKPKKESTITNLDFKSMGFCFFLVIVHAPLFYHLWLWVMYVMSHASFVMAEIQFATVLEKTEKNKPMLGIQGKTDALGEIRDDVFESVVEGISTFLTTYILPPLIVLWSSNWCRTMLHGCYPTSATSLIETLISSVPSRHQGSTHVFSFGTKPVMGIIAITFVVKIAWGLMSGVLSFSLVLFNSLFEIAWKFVDYACCGIAIFLWCIRFLPLLKFCHVVHNEQTTKELRKKEKEIKNLRNDLMDPNQNKRLWTEVTAIVAFCSFSSWSCTKRKADKMPEMQKVYYCDIRNSNPLHSNNQFNKDRYMQVCKALYFHMRQTHDDENTYRKNLITKKEFHTFSKVYKELKRCLENKNDLQGESVNYAFSLTDCVKDRLSKFDESSNRTNTYELDIDTTYDKYNTNNIQRNTQLQVFGVIIIFAVMLFVFLLPVDIFVDIEDNWTNITKMDTEFDDDRCNTTVNNSFVYTHYACPKVTAMEVLNVTGNCFQHYDKKRWRIIRTLSLAHCGSKSILQQVLNRNKDNVVKKAVEKAIIALFSKVSSHASKAVKTLMKHANKIGKYVLGGFRQFKMKLRPNSDVSIWAKLIAFFLVAVVYFLLFYISEIPM